MSGGSSYDRRTVLRGVGALGVAGTLAGCSGDGDDGSDGADSDATPTSTPTPTPTPEGTVTPTPGDDGVGVEAFLSDVSNYDQVEDVTGMDAVTVAVGAEGNGANFAFDPAAVRVDGGTTITWEWTGKGGTHNVSATEGAGFESELTGETGFTFEWTAEGSGPVLYVCEPHEGAGMKGAIVVE